MNLKEEAEYARVSFNTIKKFILMGLKVSEIDGIKRVSKSDIDDFLKSYSNWNIVTSFVREFQTTLKLINKYDMN